VFFLSFREIDVIGVYVAPSSLLLILALIPFVAVRWLASRIDLNRYVWNEPLVEVIIYILFYAIGVLTLRPF
jgi:protein AaeX